MHTLIPTHPTRKSSASARPADARQPHFECIDLPDAMKLVVYVPGVEAGGVEITTTGPDLVVTARKPQHVRANWRALHLELVQRDYHLSLRLGFGFNFEALQADMRDNMLTILAPKRSAVLGRETQHPLVA